MASYVIFCERHGRLRARLGGCCCTGGNTPERKTVKNGVRRIDMHLQNISSRTAGFSAQAFDIVLMASYVIFCERHGRLRARLGGCCCTGGNTPERETVKNGMRWERARAHPHESG